MYLLLSSIPPNKRAKAPLHCITVSVKNEKIVFVIGLQAKMKFNVSYFELLDVLVLKLTQT